MSNQIRVSTDGLKKFTTDVLAQLINKKDASITAEILLSADVRGIESHGVARLYRYIKGLQDGTIIPDVEPEIIKETPVSMVVDGMGGMGQAITYKIMQKCIEKAKTKYICFASIRNSNHYGIAGYYTKMALEENLLGISMTNSAPLVLPTFGKNAVVGTNPISVGIPAQNYPPFLLDMATSTVPRGKLEVYARKDQEIPNSWATDEKGIPTINPGIVLQNMLDRVGGGLLPLGGAGELTGGHKGFGLGVLIDIFSAVLSSGKVGSDVYREKGKPAGVCHFVGTIHPDAFLGLESIQKNMDYYIEMLKKCPKSEGDDYIYIAGEKEQTNEEKNKTCLMLQDKVFENLNNIGSNYGLLLEALK